MEKRKNQATVLRSKMMDFKRFAITLLCVGSFFYLGTILPSENNTMLSTEVYLAASALFLGMSIFFFIKSNKYRKSLDDMEDRDSLHQ